jgi:hypothetical protein
MVFPSAHFSYPFLGRRLIGFVAWFRRDLPVKRIEIGCSIGSATSPFLDKYIVPCFMLPIPLMHTHTKKT